MKTPNKVFASFILRIKDARSAVEAERLFSEMTNLGLKHNARSFSSLFSSLNKHGQPLRVLDYFSRMLSDFNVTPDNFHYASLAKAHALAGHGIEVMDVLRQMDVAGVTPDAGVYRTVLDALTQPSVIKTLTSQKLLSTCKELHKRLVDARLLSTPHLAGYLVHLYAAAGEEREAIKLALECKVDVAVWTLLIQHATTANAAVAAFDAMGKAKVKPNSRTFTCLFTALLAGDKAQLVEAYFQRMKTEFNIQPEIEHYACLVKALGECNNASGALELLSHVGPPSATHGHFYATLLSVCADGVAISAREVLIPRVMQYPELLANPYVAASLITFHAKTSNVEAALSVFESLSHATKRAVWVWNAAINACTLHGLADNANALFERMVAAGVTPNDVTFVSLLNACSHTGNVSLAQSLFSRMAEFRISPNKQHYACMVDALARSGNLDAAEKLATEKTPNHVVAWSTLLGGCRAAKDIVRAERVFTRVLELDPNDASAYVLLANTYAALGMHKEAEAVQQRRLNAGVLKPPW